MSIESCPPPALASARPNARKPAVLQRLKEDRDISGLLPIRHTLGPDQSLRRDHSSADELAELNFGVRTLLLALGRKKPGSV